MKKEFHLGQYLRAAREEAGFSQVEVAAKLGLKTSQSISDWERNHGSTLPSNAFIKLVELYGLPPAEAYRVLLEYELARTRRKLDQEIRPLLRGRRS